VAALPLSNTFLPNPPKRSGGILVPFESSNILHLPSMDPVRLKETVREMEWRSVTPSAAL
jgi:hypothetical protein